MVLEVSSKAEFRKFIFHSVFLDFWSTIVDFYLLQKFLLFFVTYHFLTVLDLRVTCKTVFKLHVHTIEYAWGPDIWTPTFLCIIVVHYTHHYEQALPSLTDMNLPWKRCGTGSKSITMAWCLTSAQELRLLQPTAATVKRALVVSLTLPPPQPVNFYLSQSTCVPLTTWRADVGMRSEVWMERKG